ncbi:tectonic [Lucilia sericata]|uniref:tectonic n=1 Tax=Lucilia sericata TaxID=13632 RepID=UPI0018A846BA|nr:tectonic [Lucilia sericata]
MDPIKVLLICQFLMITLVATKAVKIGISKPLPVTTTVVPNTTTIEETTTEEITTDVTDSPLISSTPSSTTSTTTAATKDDAEWPEFPPKKTVKISNNTTTKKPTTTTIKPSTTTTIKPLNKEINTTVKPNITEPLPTSLPKWPIKAQYCFCDLSQDTCDINCCCDPDCSADALKVFRCQLEEPIDLEIHEGRFEDFKFQHGLPSCEINDGWLCVLRTYKPLVKEEVTHSFEDTSRYNKWPNLLLESEEVKNREFYKFGDILRIFNVKTKEIQNFDLPSSYQTATCRLQEPIYHLKPLKNLIAQDIELKKERQDNFNLYKVKINILHNFTHIQELIVDLWLKENKTLDKMESTKTEYWLSYEIEFLNKTLKEFLKTNTTENVYPPVISGPLGYLLGKPIILARYEVFNKSLPLSSKNQIINYFNPNNTESHILTLFSKENGECARFNPAKDYIAYGINIAKYCKIKLENETLLLKDASKTNFTEICLNLQQHIHKQLFGEDLEIAELSFYLISQLGKPENDSQKWLPLNVFNSDFDSVIGQYLQETNTFICRNILLSLAYEFHMATYEVDNVPLQNVIKHAALHLAERHDLEFALDENLEVPITMTVRFYDVHEKAISAANSLKDLHLEYGVILVLVLVFVDLYN